MIKILISSCLVGRKVRYDGKDAFCQNQILQCWKEEGRLIPICPEVSAGLPVPRPSSEIVGSGGGDAVIGNRAKVISRSEIDQTHFFMQGANNALSLAKKHDIRMAILKSGSPSCGSREIYDGTYSGNKKPGMGVTAALLTKNNIEVFDEFHLERARAFYVQLQIYQNFRKG